MTVWSPSITSRLDPNTNAVHYLTHTVTTGALLWMEDCILVNNRLRRVTFYTPDPHRIIVYGCTTEVALHVGCVYSTIHNLLLVIAISTCTRHESLDMDEHPRCQYPTSRVLSDPSSLLRLVCSQLSETWLGF
jgi:hypothetical protein